jgi:hypothetical protein
MAVLALSCPLDDLPLLPELTTTTRGVSARDVGNHVHIGVDEATEMACLNGHAWSVVGNLKLTRVVRQRGVT